MWVFGQTLSIENQFFTHIDFFPNPIDYLTYKPFMQGYNERYDKMPEKAIADSGYGSEENADMFLRSQHTNP